MELTMYDEDLAQNPMFLCLQEQHKELYQLATTNRWIILVPRLGCVSKNSVFTRQILESHILIANPERDGCYMTPNNKEVQIENNIVCTLSGYTSSVQAALLFEETFFNESDESYCVLCINQCLEAVRTQGEDLTKPVSNSAGLPAGVTLRGLDDCMEILWGRNGNRKLEQQIQDLIDGFQKTLQKIERYDIEPYVDACQTLYHKAWTVVMKDSINKSKVQHDSSWADTIKAAIETYMTHSTYRRLYRAVRTCLARKDAALNKITRNVRSLQLTDLGVKLEFCQNVPRARKELCNLLRYSTPLGKLHCLRRVVRALSHSPRSNKPIPIGTDDLLPILIFLVVKADMPNWWANFVYMSRFRFGRSSNDNIYGFQLACLEAALEHVSTGDLENGVPFTERTVLTELASPVSSNLWPAQEKCTSLMEMFFNAVRDNDKGRVLSMLESGVKKALSPSSAGSMARCHPLCDCARCRSVEAGKAHRLELRTVTLDTRDEKNATALHVAAECGHVELLDSLIQLTRQQQQHWQQQHDEVVKQEGQIDINVTDYSNGTPLHRACAYGQQRVVLLLLDYEAKPNLQDNQGNTPLHLAVQHGHDMCVKALVYMDQGNTALEMDAPNDFGDRPIHIAAKWGFTQIVELLIENGAFVSVQNRRSLTPKQLAHNAHIAAMLIHAGEVQGTLQQGSEVTAPPGVQQAPGEQPWGAQEELTGQLIAGGRQQWLTQNAPLPRRHSTPAKMGSLSGEFSQSQSSGGGGGRMNRAASHKHPRTAAAASPDDIAAQVESLLKVVADGDIHMVRYHLGWQEEDEEEVEEAVMEARTQSLCHPLCQCDKCKPLQRFSAPSASGLHVNVCGADDLTLLHQAARHGHLHLARLLVLRGANVTARTAAQHLAPLHTAARHGHAKMVEFLHSKGASLNVRDYQGNTPLHYACLHRNHHMLKTLISLGASVNALNKKGNTPLLEAAKWGAQQCVTPLIVAGADLHTANKLGHTALQMAQNEKIAGMLREALLRESRSKRGLPSNKAEDRSFPNRYDAVSQTLTTSTTRPNTTTVSLPPAPPRQRCNTGPSTSQSTAVHSLRNPSVTAKTSARPTSLVVETTSDVDVKLKRSNSDLSPCSNVDSPQSGSMDTQKKASSSGTSSVLSHNTVVNSYNSQESVSKEYTESSDQTIKPALNSVTSPPPSASKVLDPVSTPPPHDSGSSRISPLKRAHTVGSMENMEQIITSPGSTAGGDWPMNDEEEGEDDWEELYTQRGKPPMNQSNKPAVTANQPKSTDHPDHHSTHNPGQGNPSKSSIPPTKPVQSGYIYIPGDVSTAELFCEEGSEGSEEEEEGEFERNEMNEEQFEQMQYSLSHDADEQKAREKHTKKINTNHEHSKSSPLSTGDTLGKASNLDVPNTTSVGGTSNLHRPNSTSLGETSNLDLPKTTASLDSVHQHSRQGSKTSIKSLVFVSDYYDSDGGGQSEDSTTESLRDEHVDGTTA